MLSEQLGTLGATLKGTFMLSEQLGTLGAALKGTFMSSIEVAFRSTYPSYTELVSTVRTHACIHTV